MPHHKFRQARVFLIAAAKMLLPLQPAALAQGNAAPDLALHQRLIAIDSHVDLPSEPERIDVPSAGSQFDIASARRGGITAVALAIFAPQDDDTPAKRAAAKALAQRKYRAIVNVVAAHPDEAVIATSPHQVRAAKASGLIAIIPSFLNAYTLDGLADIDLWAGRGVQVFGFVHAGHNAYADSSRPAFPRGDGPSRHGGLSELGKQAVARLNDLGVLIDVSQLSSAALRDTLALTRAPVVASHSSVAALVPVSRNLTDGELDLIKANGGVVQINAFSAYLRKDRPETTSAIAALQAEFALDAAGNPPLDEARRAEYTRRYYAIRAGEPNATLAEFVDHIDFAVKRIGIDHVGISSDFNHGGGVIGWANIAESANITAELQRRGYTDADIAKLWGENFLRVWQAAKGAAR